MAGTASTVRAAVRSGPLRPTLLVSLPRAEFLGAVSSGPSLRAAAEQAVQAYLDADADADGEIGAGSGT